jgi:hypothetical protein
MSPIGRSLSRRPSEAEPIASCERSLAWPYGNAVAAFGLERTEFERCAAAPTIGLARMLSEVFLR